jgi:hypothetical protein
MNFKINIVYALSLPVKPTFFIFHMLNIAGLYFNLESSEQDPKNSFSISFFKILSIDYDQTLWFSK